MSVAPNPKGDFGAENKIGGFYDRNPVARSKLILEANESMELRGIDISGHLLAQKYASEFQEADEKIRQKKTVTEKVKRSLFSGYGNDPHYKEWAAEIAGARESLHIHWIDDTLDSFNSLLHFGVRVFSAIGLAHGIYRTRYLWRSMDRQYAKLHGIGIGSIATWEIPLNGLKGVLCGGAFAFGCLGGDVLGRLLWCVWNGSTIRPRREWYNVLAAGTGGGLCAGVGLVAMGWNSYSVQGRILTLCLSTLVCTIVSAYFAVMDYKPFVEMYPNSYDDPNHTPWYERQRRLGGAPAVRGRYT